MAKLQIKAVGGIGESQSLPSDLMDRMREYEANVQKKRKSDAFDSAYNSLVEEYDRYKGGNKKSILSVRENSDNLLAEIEREKNSYTDIYGEERYAELYDGIKAISDDVRTAMDDNVSRAKEELDAQRRADAEIASKKEIGRKVLEEAASSPSGVISPTMSALRWLSRTVFCLFVSKVYSLSIRRGALNTVCYYITITV